MASQVLSGSSNVSYTNNTGQNVRIVINYMKAAVQTPGGITTYIISMSWAGVSISGPNSRSSYAIGRNLAFNNFGTAGISANNFSTDVGTSLNTSGNPGLPTELMLAPGQTLAITGTDAYNIVVIPEAGQSDR